MIYMNKKQYEQYVKEITPVHNLGLNMCRAFLTGGLICTLGQFILNTAQNYGLDQETAGSWCSLILILLSVLLTGLNLYSKIGKFGGAGGKSVGVRRRSRPWLPLWGSWRAKRD